jgi:1-acyl-sn-glycerol-3-phosphate acyltransferase
MVSNTQQALIVAAMLAVAATVFWVRKVRPWLKEARDYMRKATVCGFLPPPPTARGRRVIYWIGRIFTWFQVGPVRVYGKENLQSPGPKMLCANHGSHADPPLAALITNGSTRFIAADQVFKFGGGIGALIMGPLGVFPCNLQKGQGRPARDACIKVLANGEDLVLFPEGISWADGEVREFKKGAVFITKAAAEALGAPAYILPYYIRYNRYAGKWILKYPWVYQYFWILFNAWYYRRGVTVVVGKPISSAELPVDDVAGTELLRQRILELDPAVNKPEGKPWVIR